jgi:hypothetical protein
MRVLAPTAFRNVLHSHSLGGWPQLPGYGETGRPGRQSRLQPRLETVPSEVGRDLMMSGAFGNNDRSMDNRKQKKRVSWRILQREIGGGGLGRERSKMSLLKQVGSGRPCRFSLAYHIAGADPRIGRYCRCNYKSRDAMLFRPVFRRR